MRVRLGCQIDGDEFRQVGFSLDVLGPCLHETGFPQLMRVEESGRFNDARPMEFAGAPIGLTVIAPKVANRPEFSHGHARRGVRPAVGALSQDRADRAAGAGADLQPQLRCSCHCRQSWRSEGTMRAKCANRPGPPSMAMRASPAV
jgi:hypothetical protein